MYASLPFPPHLSKSLPGGGGLVGASSLACIGAGLQQSVRPFKKDLREPTCNVFLQRRHAKFALNLRSELTRNVSLRADRNFCTRNRHAMFLFRADTQCLYSERTRDGTQASMS